MARIVNLVRYCYTQGIQRAPARNNIALKHGTVHWEAEAADKHSSKTEHSQQQDPRRSRSN